LVRLIVYATPIGGAFIGGAFALLSEQKNEATGA
jgi:hypothetical protein